eukprot:1602648-Prymnesium_polylepis.1
MGLVVRVRVGECVRARTHLVPAERPPQPLAIEREERGGRQLAGARLRAEADLDAPEHRARRQLDVL